LDYIEETHSTQTVICTSRITSYIHTATYVYIKETKTRSNNARRYSNIEHNKTRTRKTKTASDEMPQDEQHSTY